MSERKPEDVVDPDIAAGETALNWALARGCGDRIAIRSRVRRRRQRRLHRLTTGSLMIVMLVAAGFLWRLHLVPPASMQAPPSSSVLVTALATHLLPDGSVIELKEGANIEIDYSPAFRRVRLIEGRAHFTVAKNQVAPFIVIVGELEVRAVGTEFSVHMDARRVEVLVTEGRVDVDQTIQPVAAGSPQNARSVRASRQTLATVDAGNRVVVEVAAAVEPPAVLAVSTTEQNELLSWRVPSIELSATPLSEALPIFNRYCPVSLSLADPSLGALKLSGVLRPNNPNALFHVLKVEFGLEVELSADGGFVLRRP
jgi:transmembrane sensor